MLTKQQKEFYDLVFYQVYPRSFNDSNGDGIGDIKGITAKLDYLRELGVNAVWLSPCYKSPNVDGGYDVADYCDIMDEFGTLDDWKEMIDGMHKRGIKLIMDFVANHTSNEHKWFKEARKSKDNPYRDYYYWADEPLNDWRTDFGGSAWEYDDVAGQYYLHSFTPEQPDLNWENPKVREEMIKVLDFWVDLGVDGFRCDAFDMIAKDFEKGQNGNAPHLHDYIKMLFDRDNMRDKFNVGECWAANEEVFKLLTDGSRNELTTAFLFDHVCVGQKDNCFDPIPFTLDDMRDIFVKWQNFMKENELLGTLFVENHDLPRCVSRFANDSDKRYESATLLATMCFLQKGVPFIYQGQEIGMTNSFAATIDEFEDPKSKNFLRANVKGLPYDELIKNINYGSRDNGRHLIPWNVKEYEKNSANMWIAPYKHYKEINVEQDAVAEKSVRKYFKELIKLRKSTAAFKGGDYEDITDGRRGIYVYKRYTDSECYVVVCNFENENDLDIDVSGECILSNGETRPINGTYQPYECAVYKCRGGESR